MAPTPKDTTISTKISPYRKYMSVLLHHDRAALVLHATGLGVLRGDRELVAVASDLHARDLDARLLEVVHDHAGALERDVRTLDRAAVGVPAHRDVDRTARGEELADLADHVAPGRGQVRGVARERDALVVRRAIDLVLDVLAGARLSRRGIDALRLHRHDPGHPGQHVFDLVGVTSGRHLGGHAAAVQDELHPVHPGLGQ